MQVSLINKYNWYLPFLGIYFFCIQKYEKCLKVKRALILTLDSYSRVLEEDPLQAALHQVDYDLAGNLGQAKRDPEMLTSRSKLVSRISYESSCQIREWGWD